MDVMPDKQNIDQVFSGTMYYIDFYQRQYKWNDEPVKRLLDDIFYKFNLEFEQYKENETEPEKLVEKYSWYYLNTYVTNRINGKLFIVDGQQRLTTLTLILIKLYHQAELNNDLKLLHNPAEVKLFLKKTFLYYTNFFSRIYQYYNQPDDDYIHIFYNRLTETDSQFLLILSACSPDDPEEDEKLKTVSYQVDRLFSLLQLLLDVRGVNTNDVFSYSLFKDTGIEEDSYKAKLDFTAMKNNFKLNFRPIDSFGPNELEERHQLKNGINYCTIFPKLSGNNRVLRRSHGRGNYSAQGVRGYAGGAFPPFLGPPFGPVLPVRKTAAVPG